MLRALRGVCLICLCIVGAAVVMAFLELAAYSTILTATGCRSAEVLFSFTCGDGWIGQSIALVLNLPSLFSSAPEFTFSPAGASLSRGYLVLLYLFDAILVLALTYPLLLLFGRKKVRPSI
jgi:hypothetical protein